MAFLSIFSGCFYLGPPFSASKEFSALPLDTPVVVGVTHVKLGSDSDSNKVFWDYTKKVVDSLSGRPGYLGHRVRKKIFVDDAWTMTMWRDEDALNRFVRSGLHGKAMAKGLSAVKQARFLRLTLPRSETPIDWSKVEKLMEANGRTLY